MLLSIALILIMGMSLGHVCKKLKLPPLIGMIFTGIILGPYVFNLIDPKILNISSELRKIALIIILTRAGLTLDLNDLKKVGRPAILMCFLPATLEILAMTMIAPLFFDISYLDAAIIGTVIAAVSPAVIVPRMITLIENKYGTQKGIPQLILAGASVDDVYVIVLFSALTTLASGHDVSIMSFINIPVSIVLGIIIGWVLGYVLNQYFNTFHLRDTIKVLIMLSLFFILTSIEDMMTTSITFSSLIAIMFTGISYNKYNPVVTKRLSVKFNKLWLGAEVFLFVLVGALVNIEYALKAGILSIILIICVLIFRMLGVYLCLIKTNLNLKERIFCMFGYMPKATVQAAIGGIPLSMGLACGDLALTIAVLAIILTAPVGAAMIDFLYEKCLEHHA